MGGRGGVLGGARILHLLTFRGEKVTTKQVKKLQQSKTKVSHNLATLLQAEWHREEQIFHLQAPRVFGQEACCATGSLLAARSRVGNITRSPAIVPPAKALVNPQLLFLVNATAQELSTQRRTWPPAEVLKSWEGHLKSRKMVNTNTQGTHSFGNRRIATVSPSALRSP